MKMTMLKVLVIVDSSNSDVEFNDYDGSIDIQVNANSYDDAVDIVDCNKCNKEIRENLLLNQSQLINLYTNQHSLILIFNLY